MTVIGSTFYLFVARISERVGETPNPCSSRRHKRWWCGRRVDDRDL